MIIEFCFNVRYIVRHGRCASTPWSLRQTAVYQKLNFQDYKSIWMILQPPTNTYGRVMATLEKHQNEQCEISTNPMQFHLFFLLGTIANWKEYLSDLNDELMELVSAFEIE